MSTPPAGPLKLNLGCGQNHRPGYVNVDRAGSPDVKWDLEQFPWPWEDNSVGEIMMTHVLEHLGETTATYFKIVQELYRVCQDGAIIQITVPHPRHDDFLNDPTHVRAVTPESWRLLSKAFNRMWKAGGFSDSPLGMYLDVDFDIVSVHYVVAPAWKQRVASGVATQQQVAELVGQLNNVVKEIQFAVKVIKSDGQGRKTEAHRVNFIMPD